MLPKVPCARFARDQRGQGSLEFGVIALTTLAIGLASVAMFGKVAGGRMSPTDNDVAHHASGQNGNDDVRAYGRSLGDLGNGSDVEAAGLEEDPVQAAIVGNGATTSRTWKRIWWLAANLSLVGIPIAWTIADATGDTIEYTEFQSVFWPTAGRALTGMVTGLVDLAVALPEIAPAAASAVWDDWTVAPAFAKTAASAIYGTVEQGALTFHYGSNAEFASVAGNLAIEVWTAGGGGGAGTVATKRAMRARQVLHAVEEVAEVASTARAAKLAHAGAILGEKAARHVDDVGHVAATTTRHVDDVERVVATTARHSDDVERAVAKVARRTDDAEAIVANSARRADDAPVAAGRARDTSLCFTAGTPIHMVEGVRAIETVKLGERVLTIRGAVENATEVSSTWRRIELAMDDPRGPEATVHIALLRSRAWIGQVDARVGATIELSLPEMHIRGRARVLSIGDAPPVEPGIGRVVIATIVSRSSDVVALKLHGTDETLEPTFSHRLYSLDRNDWVEAGKLRIGERLRTIRGEAVVASIQNKPGTHTVYNFEVEEEHEYLVGTLGVRSHNPCMQEPPGNRAVAASEVPALRKIRLPDAPPPRLGTKWHGVAEDAPPHVESWVFPRARNEELLANEARVAQRRAAREIVSSERDDLLARAAAADDPHMRAQLEGAAGFLDNSELNRRLGSRPIHEVDDFLARYGEVAHQGPAAAFNAAARELADVDQAVAKKLFPEAFPSRSRSRAATPEAVAHADAPPAAATNGVARELSDGVTPIAAAHDVPETIVARLVDDTGSVSDDIFDATASRGRGGLVHHADEVMPTQQAAHGGGGLCFVAGTGVQTSNGLAAIEDIELGERVLTLSESETVASEVDSTWRRVELEMDDPRSADGKIILALLRSPEWVKSRGAHPGARIDFALEEMGVRGLAHVTAIGDAPSIKAGPGRVVLATIASQSNEVRILRLRGPPSDARVVAIEPTAGHRLFSLDRNAWIRSSELRIGERLRTREGEALIESIEKRPGTHRVFNLEVETDHSYLVGALGVLSHNDQDCIQPLPAARQAPAHIIRGNNAPPELIVTSKTPTRSINDEGGWTRGNGGVVTAIEDMGRRLPVTSVSQPASPSDRRLALAGTALEVDRMRLRFVPIDDATNTGFTWTHSEFWWFTHHRMTEMLDPGLLNAPRRGDAWERAWRGYVRANQEFATVVADEVRHRGGHALVHNNDFQLNLVPGQLRSLLGDAGLPQVPIAHFSHIPEPDAAWWEGIHRRAFIEARCRSLMQCDVVGVQTPRDAANFVQAAEHFVPGTFVNQLDTQSFELWAAGSDHSTLVKAYPISINPDLVARAAGIDASALLQTGYVAARPAIDGVRTVVGTVARIDPMKNLVWGFEAFAELLRRRRDLTEWGNRVVYKAYLSPSRMDLAPYAKYYEETIARVERINAEHPGWNPIQLQIGQWSYGEILRRMAEFDVGFIPSKWDGMNLTALELVAGNPRAVLVISEQVGASQRLAVGKLGALLFDPTVMDQAVNQLETAVGLYDWQRIGRGMAMLGRIQSYTINEWIDRQLNDLVQRARYNRPNTNPQIHPQVLPPSPE